MKKLPIMQLVFIDPILWRVAKDELPDRKTRYAGKFGVFVNAFNLQEYIDSGSYMPCHIWYGFKKKQFMDLAYEGNDVAWLPIDVTHWLPLPPIPVFNEQESRTAQSKMGFRYFKGSDKLSKKFVEI